MKTILYEYPLPLGGFILGFASLGNLLQSYGPYGGTVRNVLGGYPVFYSYYLWVNSYFILKR